MTTEQQQLNATKRNMAFMFGLHNFRLQLAQLSTIGMAGELFYLTDASTTRKTLVASALL